MESSSPNLIPLSNMPAIELRDLRKSFGRIAVIGGVNLAVVHGERHAMIGPNGAGKSTLLHLITGHLRPTQGRIEIDGRDVTGAPAHKIYRAGLARNFQITNIFHRLSVLENLRCAALWSLGHRYVWWRSIASLDDVNARAEQTMEEIGLAARRNTVAGELSYAEQRALEMGLAIIGEPSVILLDEPTAGMNRAETARATELIRKVTAPPRTLLMVEHDMNVVFGLADRVSVLVSGEIIATGSPGEIRSNPAVQKAYLGREAAHAAGP